MWAPWGDHVGSNSNAAASVRRTGCEPFASAIQMSSVSSEKTIRTSRDRTSIGLPRGAPVPVGDGPDMPGGSGATDGAERADVHAATMTATDTHAYRMSSLPVAVDEGSRDGSFLEDDRAGATQPWTVGRMPAARACRRHRRTGSWP